MSGMILPRDEPQIFDGIVQFVAVDMMDQFVTAEHPAQMTGHDVPVFKHARPVDGDVAVAIQANAAFAVRCFRLPGRIAMTHQAQVVGVTQPTPAHGPIAALQGAVIGRVVRDKSTRGMVFSHAVHGSSSLAQYTIDANGIVPSGALVIKRVNSGEPRPGHAEGNPEPSRACTLGRCNDYRRGAVPLMTGMSARRESEEIVYSPQ